MKLPTGIISPRWWTNTPTYPGLSTTITTSSPRSATATNAWLAWEYYSEDKGEGYAVFFRRRRDRGDATIKLKGLDPDKMYHLWFEDRGDYRYLSGLSLMRDGLQVSLPASETSDILHILDASQNSYTARALETAMTQVAHNGPAPRRDRDRTRGGGCARVHAAHGSAPEHDDERPAARSGRG